jgi:SAM-dependent methyltransferase
MTSVDLDFVEAVRSEELRRLMRFFPATGRVLDFGAGAGYQALRLAQLGYQVDAVDLAASQYTSARVFPVVGYDGQVLPFATGSFDVVFSSNVLEHVSNLERTLAEMQRVLKRNGVMIHVLPSTTWRLWSTLAEFAGVPRDVLRILKDRSAGSGRLMKIVRRAGRPLLFRRHGETGSALSELYSFSRFAWSRKFRHMRCHVRQRVPLQMTYTGESLFGSQISFGTRMKLARCLGSSTMAWVIECR